MPSLLDTTQPDDGKPVAKATFRNAFSIIKSELDHGGYFKHDLGGAVERSVSNRLSETVSVRDFGAVGDGRADDAPAMQRAIDSVGQRGGGRILVPAGMKLNFASYQVEPSTIFSSQQFCILINYDNIEIAMEAGSVIRSDLVPRISTAGAGYGYYSGIGGLFFINGSRKNGGTIDTALVGRANARLYPFASAPRNAPGIRLLDPLQRSEFAVGDWIFIRTGQMTNNGGNTGDAEFNQIVEIGADGFLWLKEPLKKSYRPENYPLSYTLDTAKRGQPAPFGIVRATEYLLHNIKLDVIIDAPHFNAVQQWQARDVDVRVRGRCRSVVLGGSWMKETRAHGWRVDLSGSGSEGDPEDPGDWAFAIGTGSSECELVDFDILSRGRSFIHVHEGSANSRIANGRLKAIRNRDNDAAISIRARAYDIRVENMFIACPLIPAWQAKESVLEGEYRSFGGQVYRAIVAGTAAADPTRAPRHTLKTVSDGNVSWRPMGPIRAWAPGEIVAARAYRLHNGHILHATSAGTTAGNGPDLGAAPQPGTIGKDAGGVEWEVLKNDVAANPAGWEAGRPMSNSGFRHHGGFLFQATSSGTAGATPPATAMAALLDDTGGIYWLYAGTTVQTGVFVDESCAGGGTLSNITTHVEGGPGISVRARNWATVECRDIGVSSGVGVSLREQVDRLLIPAQDLATMSGTGALGASSGTGSTGLVAPYRQLKDAEFGRAGRQIVLPPAWREVEIYLWVSNPNPTPGRVVARAGLQSLQPGDVIGVTAPNTWTGLPSNVSTGAIATANGRIYQTSAGGTKGSTAPSHTGLAPDNGTLAVGATWRYLAPKVDWAAGQAVQAGDLRTSGSRIYRALGAGTTGATAPSGTTTSSDGTVTWGYVASFANWGGGVSYFDAITTNGSYVAANGQLYAAYDTGLSGDSAPLHTDLASDGSTTWRYMGSELVANSALYTAEPQNVLQAVRISPTFRLGDSRHPYLLTIERDGAHALDTLAGDIRVHSVEVRRSL
jgi:hypothetical protein